MRKINFTKMVASGNDFIVAEPRTKNQELRNFARRACDRKYGAGADGLLVLGKSRIADVKMRVFNADGSEAEMCGNGARCAALYAARIKYPRMLRDRQVSPNASGQASIKIKIETKAGIIEAEVGGDNVRIKLTEPKNLKLDLPIKISHRLLKVNFINTGVPHAVVFVEGLDRIDVVNLGRVIRCHKKFAPAGTNVDFVEVLGSGSIKVRTYERGVEDETLACGTGSVASALILGIRYPRLQRDRQVSGIRKMNVQTQGGEILKVYFKRAEKSFKNVWLEGKAKIVYKGEYYVK